MQALRLPTAHGWRWIAEGFRLFRRNPALLTLLALNYWLSFFLVFLIPFVGPFAANVVLQTLSVTVMNGCRAVDEGRSVGLDVVWSGFKRNLPVLLKLGVLYLACELAIAAVLVGIYGSTPFESMNPAGKPDVEPAPEAKDVTSFVYSALILTLPLILSFWFAPLLVAWKDLGAFKSLFFSVVAVARNWRAFLVYGAAAMLLTAVAPGLLRALFGFSDSLLMLASAAVTIVLVFVAMPTLFASVYVSFRDVFAEDESAVTDA